MFTKAQEYPQEMLMNFETSERGSRDRALLEGCGSTRLTLNIEPRSTTTINIPHDFNNSPHNTANMSVAQNPLSSDLIWAVTRMFLPE